MSYHQLTPEQFTQYQANPLGMEATVRKWANLPDDKCFSVSVWPEHLVGRVFLSNKPKKKQH